MRRALPFVLLSLLCSSAAFGQGAGPWYWDEDRLNSLNTASFGTNGGTTNHPAYSNGQVNNLAPWESATVNVSGLVVTPGSTCHVVFFIAAPVDPEDGMPFDPGPPPVFEIGWVDSIGAWSDGWTEYSGYGGKTYQFTAPSSDVGAAIRWKSGGNVMIDRVKFAAEPAPINPPDTDGDGCPDHEDDWPLDNAKGCDNPPPPGCPGDLDCDEIPDEEDNDPDGDGCVGPGDAFPMDPEQGCEGCDQLTDWDCDGIPDANDDDDDNDGCLDVNDGAPNDPNDGCDCANDLDCDGCLDHEEGVICNCPGDQDCDDIPDETDPCPDDPSNSCCGDVNDGDCDGCPNDDDPEPYNPEVGCPCTDPNDSDCDGCPNTLDPEPENPAVGCPTECPGDLDCDECPDAEDPEPQNPAVGCQEEPPPEEPHCCSCCCTQCQGGEEPGEVPDRDPFNPQFQLEFASVDLSAQGADALKDVPQDLGVRDHQLGLDFSVDYEGRSFFNGMSTWTWIPSVANGWDAATVAQIEFWLPILRMIIILAIWIQFGQYFIKTFARW